MTTQSVSGMSRREMWFLAHSEGTMAGGGGFNSRQTEDGIRGVSGSYDNTICIWDVETGDVVSGPFRGHDGGVTSVSFSPDSKRVVSGSYDNTIRVWDVETGDMVFGPFRGHNGWVRSVSFSSDGKRVVSGSYDETIRIW